MCSRELVTVKKMSTNRIVELEERTSLLYQEVLRLRQENTEIVQLKHENTKLQEKNLQLAAELSVKTRELEKASEHCRNVSRNDTSEDTVEVGDIKCCP